jgi:hypothetical protein
LVGAHRKLDVRAAPHFLADDEIGERGGHVALDGALEETSAELGVVAVGGGPIEQHVVDVELDGPRANARPFAQRCNLAQRDIANIVPR